MRQIRFGVLIAAAVLISGMEFVTPQETGISLKKPVFGGACKICPWGAIGEIVKAAMKPYDYDVQLCYNCARQDAPRIVAGAQIPPVLVDVPGVPRIQRPEPPKGPVEFGATSTQAVWAAYQGTGAYAKEGPRKNLRLLATIQSPSYTIVAVRSGLGITDLAQIREKRLPVHVVVNGEDGNAILAYYGLSEDFIKAAGGSVSPGGVQTPEERSRIFKDLDVIIHNGSLGNAPEFNIWYDASQHLDLNYLQLPEVLLDKLAKNFDLQRGTIPNGLLRGIDRPIPTVVRSGISVYGRDDMPDDFAYTVAKALDQQQDLLQWAHLNFSYNVWTVWKGYGVPLHPGAAKYYRERGYMK